MRGKGAQRWGDVGSSAIENGSCGLKSDTWVETRARTERNREVHCRAGSKARNQACGELKGRVKCDESMYATAEVRSGSKPHLVSLGSMVG